MGAFASIDDTDESLMRGIRSRSHQAFAVLVRRHTDRFFAASYRMCGNTAQAEDMVQDAFLKIWNRPDLWDEARGVKFTTWFYRILLNQNIDRIRKSKFMTGDDAVLAFVPDKAASPEQDTVAREEQRHIEDALAALPERQRTALTLCFYEGLSNADAAAAMGVKIKALESLLMRAKTGLREYFTNNETSKKRGIYAA
jgi:RNA polymerase sigma-70 factor, ECF subfamily